MWPTLIVLANICWLFIMPDFSLVPVDHQPEFEGVSLVPVDYDPFGPSTESPQNLSSTFGYPSSLSFPTTITANANYLSRTGAVAVPRAAADANDVEAFTATPVPRSEHSSVQLAQAFPPTIFARPPVITPEGLTPLEELPAGSSGGSGAGKPFPRSFNEQQQDSVPCIYCGDPTTRTPGPDRLHGDHVIPRSQGGNNGPKNYGPSCQTCNLQKGPRTPEEWYNWILRGGV
jgi:hypothetical protein